MTKQPTPLRQRMIEDMTIRNMAPSTQKIYVAAVANFSIFHGRSPDKLTFEDVRGYRLHLISRGLKPNSIKPIMGALRFRPYVFSILTVTSFAASDAMEPPSRWRAGLLPHPT